MIKDYQFEADLLIVMKDSHVTIHYILDTIYDSGSVYVALTNILEIAKLSILVATLIERRG